MNGPERFFAGALHASLPLWLWAAHFAFCYAVVAAGCDAGWHDIGLAGTSLLRAVLLLASALALALAAWLLRSACRAPARPADGLYARVRLLAAGLALVGIAWTSVPGIVLATCLAT